jgi:Putative transmembrane protein (PGPGW)
MRASILRAMMLTRRILTRAGLDLVPPAVRKIVIAVIGTTILLIGVALIVLPGPAFIVIPIGLSILASEFIWARRVIKRGRIFVKKVKRRVTR